LTAWLAGFGAVVDGVGFGGAVIATQVFGVDATVCQDPCCAGPARSHADTTVFCLGVKMIGSALAPEVVRIWMSTEWLGAVEEKDARRVGTVRQINDRDLVPPS